MSFFEELKRRNVFRVGVAYAISAWVLLQVMDLVLDNTDAPDWVMDVFMIVVLLGFVVALVIAWAYEMTPEGIRKEADVDRDESVTHHTAKKLDVITLVAIGAMALLIVGERLIGPAPEPAPATEAGETETAQISTPASADPAPVAIAPEIDNKSIAVLPLANRSVNEEDAFFAEGMHDEILTRLSRIGSLKVISRTSVMGYADTTKKMAEIGQELGVATLLEGGVQRAGNRVRVNVQLIEAATDKHLWAEIFDRELTADNLFDIQSEITRSISDALEAVLTGDEQLALNDKPTENLEAYAYYLRAKAMSAGYGRPEGELRSSISIYESAIALDPNFAAAWAAISTDWTELQWTTGGTSNELANAEKALAKAQELAPEAAETLTAEGYVHYWGYLEYQKALDAFDAALAKKPGSVLALRGKAYVQRRMGRLDESASTFRRAIELDPNDPGMPADFGYLLLRKGDMQEAETMFRRSIAQAPDNWWNRWSYSFYFWQLSDLESAIEVLGEPLDDSPGFVFASHYYFARILGDEQAMQNAMTDWEGNEDIPGQAKLAYGQLLFTEGKLDGYRNTLLSLEQDFLSALETATRKETVLAELITLYGLLGDREKLEQTIHRLETDINPDAMRIIEVTSPYYAWTMIGEKGKALDLAEQIVEEFGIWEIYIFITDPIFDSLRGEPRYKQLALEYDRWLESVQ
jgi:TolB-like protein